MLDTEVEVAIKYLVKYVRKLQRLKFKRAQLDLQIAKAEGELMSLAMHDLAKLIGQPIDPVFLPARTSKKCVVRNIAVKVRK